VIGARVRGTKQLWDEGIGVDEQLRIEGFQGLRSELDRLGREQTALGRRSVGSARFLPGEDRDASDPTLARHWASVYAELIQFKEDLLAEVQRRAESWGPALVAESLREARRLQPELEQLRLHRQFWEDRCAAVPRQHNELGRRQAEERMQRAREAERRAEAALSRARAALERLRALQARSAAGPERRSMDSAPAERGRLPKRTG
jgi:chromosome segregation ATPase